MDKKNCKSLLGGLQEMLDSKFRTAQYRFRHHLINAIDVAMYSNTFNNYALSIVRKDGNIMRGYENVIDIYIPRDVRYDDSIMEDPNNQHVKSWINTWLKANKPGYALDAALRGNSFIEVSIVPSKGELSGEYIFDDENDPILEVTIDGLFKYLNNFINYDATESFEFMFDVKNDEQSEDLQKALAKGFPAGLTSIINKTINEAINGYSIEVLYIFTELKLSVHVKGNMVDYVPEDVDTTVNEKEEPKAEEPEAPAQEMLFDDDVKAEADDETDEEADRGPITVSDICRECHVSAQSVKKYTMLHRVSLETAYEHYKSNMGNRGGSGVGVKVNGKFYDTINDACVALGVSYNTVYAMRTNTGMTTEQCIEALVNNTNGEDAQKQPGGGNSIPVKFADGTEFPSLTAMIASLDVSWSTYAKWKNQNGWSDEEAYYAFKNGTVDKLRQSPGASRRIEITLSDGRHFESVTKMLEAGGFTAAQLYEVMAQFNVDHADAFEYLESEAKNK